MMYQHQRICFWTTIFFVALCLSFFLQAFTFGAPQQRALTRQQQQVVQRANKLSQNAISLDKAGKTSEALENAKEALKLFQSVYRQPNAATVFHQHFVGVLYNQLGDNRAAIRYLEPAYRNGVKTTNQWNDNTFQTLKFLSGAHAALEEWDKAESWMTRFHDLVLKKKGKFHKEAVYGRNALYQIYIAKNEPQRAQQLAKRVLDASVKEFGESTLKNVDNINRYAAISNAIKDFETAEKAYQRSLNILEKITKPNDFARREPHMWLSTIATGRGDHKLAQFHLKKAYDLTTQEMGKAHEQSNEFLLRLASAAESSGDEMLALSYMKNALAIQRNVSETPNARLASVLSRLGYFHMYRGELGEARSCLAEALEINRAKFGTDHKETAKSLYFWGSILGLQKNYEESLKFFKQALKIQMELLGEENSDTASTSIAIGGTYQSLGDYESARPYFEKTLAVHTKLFGDNHWQTAETSKNYGNHLAFQGKLDEALPYLQKSLRINQQLTGNDSPETAKSLIALAGWNRDKNNNKVAIDYYEQALQIYEEALAGTRLDAASAAHVNLAALHLQQGDQDKTLEQFSLAQKKLTIFVNDVLPSLTQTEQLRFLQYEFQSYFSDLLSLALSRYSNQDVLNLTCEWVLNGKGLQHESLVRSNQIGRAISNDPTYGQKLKQLETLRRDLANLSLSAPSAGEKEKRQIRLASLQKQIFDLQQELKGFVSDTNVSRQRWLELRQIREELSSKSTLIEIVKLRELDFGQVPNEKISRKGIRYVAWIIPALGKGDVRFVDLGLAEKIDPLVQNLRKEISSTAEFQTNQNIGELDAVQNLEPIMAELAQRVWEPIADALPQQAQNLIISPDGSLWLVPWAALPADGAMDRVLIEDFAIQYEVTGRNLTASNRKPKTIEKSVVFADPDYDLPVDDIQKTLNQMLPNEPFVQTETQLISQTSIQRVARLPGTKAEVEAVTPSLKKLTGETPNTYVGKLAMESALKRVQNPPVLMLSTHGFFLTDQETDLGGGNFANVRGVSQQGIAIENPLLRCGLLMTGVNSQAVVGGDDGIMTGLEVAGLELADTEMVVLSACDTGIGEVNVGDGVAGLRQSFQLAGAHSVVSTLWSIPDRESARLMKAFFQNLAKGQSRSEALRQAQLERIKNRRQRYGAAHPLYWAAWTVTGDSGTLLDEELLQLRDLIKKAGAGEADAQYRLGKKYLEGTDTPQNFEKALTWIRKSAEQNDPQGINAYGDLYSQGKGVEQNLEKANELYRRAADMGLARAQRNLALQYQKGQGVAVDQELAFKWLRKAADQGMPMAMVDVGLAFENGQGVEKNLEKANEWFQKAADLNEAQGLTNLGRNYLKGIGVKKSEAEAFRLLKKAADSGFPRAQTQLGDCFYFGRGTERDYARALRNYRKAAAQNWAAAMSDIGYMYEHGMGVPKDLTRAIRSYRNACELKSDRGLCDLGHLFQIGRGLPKNPERAVELYRETAENGYARGQKMLGFMLEKGLGVEKDVEQALEWYLKSAKQEYPSSMYRIGRLHKEGIGVEQNIETAMEWYRKAAELDDADAQSMLAYILMNGTDGVAKDQPRAIELYRKAAEKNDLMALNNLGYIYEYGEGAEQDFAKSLHYYQLAANDGEATSQYNVGRFYEFGKGVDRNNQKAAEWYQKAADQGHLTAQNNLGSLYEDGRGVSQNVAKAFELYTLAAEKGSHYAQRNLARFYLAGTGVEKDPKLAFEWFEKSANQGNKWAQNQLGECYRDGTGTSKDLVKAAAWFRKSVDQGNIQASRNLGLALLRGEGVDKNKLEGQKLLAFASKEGDFQAIIFTADRSNATNTLDVANRFFEGRGIDKDFAKAADWYRASAEAGNTDAQYKLGRMLNLGLGITQDKKEAVHWFEKASNQGHTDSKFRLAVALLNGDGIERDQNRSETLLVEAMVSSFDQPRDSSAVTPTPTPPPSAPTERDRKKLLRDEKLAERGNPQAQFRFGLALLKGTLVAKDEAKAVQLFRNSAGKGNSDAQYQLAVCLLQGIGIESNPPEGIELLKKAAEFANCNADACYLLGTYYESGKHVEKDTIAAERQYRFAATQGNAQAQHKLSLLAGNESKPIKNPKSKLRWALKNIRKGAAVEQNVIRKLALAAAKEKIQELDLADSKAIYEIGYDHQFGINGPKDPKAAFIYYSTAAKRGYARAQFRLGYLYHFAEGTSNDNQLAYRWYRAAAEQNEYDAMQNIGVMYEYGRLGDDKTHLAVEWYRKAAEAGWASSQESLSNAYYYGDGVEKDYEKAFYWAQKAAAQGRSSAYGDIGKMYRWGKGVEQNYATAMKWYLKGATKGDTFAQSEIGDLYFYGRGVAKDFKEAATWYRKAADQGHASSQCDMGYAYLNGHGVAVDEAEAFQWFKKAADQGNSRAQFMVGGFYSGKFADEKIVKMDVLEAFKWYQLSAKKGRANAQCELGTCYLRGFGTKQDDNQGRVWLTKAAKQDHARSQFLLGLLYWEGKGVTQNRRLAKHWIEKSAAQNYNPAVNFLRNANE